MCLCAIVLSVCGCVRLLSPTLTPRLQLLITRGVCSCDVALQAAVALQVGGVEAGAAFKEPFVSGEVKIPSNKSHRL